MALIVLPEGTQISGSIGGTTYAHNRYGAYKRNRSVPVNPNTDRQVAARNALRALSIAWNQTLTPVQRAMWDLYGENVSWVNKLGQTVHLPGAVHYNRSNQPRVIGGDPIVNDGPGYFNLGAAEQALAVTASEGTQLLSIEFNNTYAWAHEDDSSQYVQMGIPKNASTVFFGGPWRYAGAIQGDSVTPPTSPQTIAVPFPIAEGQRLWVRTRISRADGRLSGFAQVNFLCAV